MTNIFLISAGAAAGALSRHWLNALIAHAMEPGALPVGIICVNLAGCFLIGMLYGSGNGPEDGSGTALRMIFATGFLGSFTTFSAFAEGTLLLMDKGFPYKAFLNVIISVAGGLAAAWAGMKLALRMF